MNRIRDSRRYRRQRTRKQSLFGTVQIRSRIQRTITIQIMLHPYHRQHRDIVQIQEEKCP